MSTPSGSGPDSMMGRSPRVVVMLRRRHRTPPRPTPAAAPTRHLTPAPGAHLPAGTKTAPLLREPPPGRPATAPSTSAPGSRAPTRCVTPASTTTTATAPKTSRMTTRTTRRACTTARSPACPELLSVSRGHRDETLLDPPWAQPRPRPTFDSRPAAALQPAGNSAAWDSYPSARPATASADLCAPTSAPAPVWAAAGRRQVRW